MGHRIHFNCDGREVRVEHNETVLEAAIRAGLNVNYGCNSGNCGLCAARLIEGDLLKVRHYDYTFSAAEKAGNFFLMCSHTAQSNIVLEAQIADVTDRIAMQSFRAKVRSVTAPSYKVRVVTVQPSRRHRLRFMAGQSARLSSDGGVAGEFSIASCPCDARRLEFHVPRAQNSFFHRYVFNDCTPGETLEVEAPFGGFVFAEEFSRPLVLIAFSMGFAAVKSLFEHVSAQESEIPIRLYWAALPDEHYLDNLCRSWNDALDQVYYRRIKLGSYEDRALRDCTADMIETLSDLREADIYCCAPPQVAELLGQMVAERRRWRLFSKPTDDYRGRAL